MQLLDIKIDNAFSFGTAVFFDFTTLENHTQLIGTNLDEDIEGSSNGSGKTSLYLCVQQALYGRDSKDTLKADIANTLGDGSYAITLHFLEKGFVYSVTTARSSGGKSSLLLTRDGSDISAHTITGTQKLLSSIVGLDFHLFTQLTYQSSTQFLDLLAATDAERKKVLVKLFSLGRYDEQVELYKELLREASVEMRVADATFSQIEKAVTVEVAPMIFVDDFPYDREIDDLRESIAMGRAKTDRLSELNREYRAHSAISKELEILTRKLDNLDNPKRVDTTDLVATKNRLSEEKVKYTILLTKYKDSPKNCRTCGQSVPTEHNTLKATECVNRLLVINNDIEVNKAALQDAAIISNRADLYEFTENSILSKSHALDPSKIKDPLSTQKHEANIVSLVERLNAFIAEQKATTSRIAKAEAHNARQLLLEEQKVEAKKNLSKASLESVKCRETAALYKTLFDASKLLVTFKLESLLLFLQESVNTYVDTLFKGDVALLIGTTKGKLTFTILKDGKNYSIKRLSTGERARLNIAMLLALRDTLGSLSGAEVDFLVLDEILSSLDSSGRAAIYDILEKLPYKIISISHSYQDNRLPIINVVKENGITRIEDL